MPERQYHANGRAAVASRDRPAVPLPGTPSRKDKLRESSALQDPGLKDYVRKYSSRLRRAYIYDLAFWRGNSLVMAKGLAGSYKNANRLV